MFNLTKELIFSIGLSVANVSTDWGNVDTVNNTVRTNSINVEYNNFMFSYKHGNSDWNTGYYNNIIQETSLKDINIFRVTYHHDVTNKLSLVSGIQYASFKDYDLIGTRLSKGTDADWGTVLGIKYDINSDWFIQLDHSTYYDKNKYVDHFNGSVVVKATDLSINYKF